MVLINCENIMATVVVSHKHPPPPHARAHAYYYSNLNRTQNCNTKFIICNKSQWSSSLHKYFIKDINLSEHIENHIYVWIIQHHFKATSTIDFVQNNIYVTCIYVIIPIYTGMCVIIFTLSDQIALECFWQPMIHSIQNVQCGHILSPHDTF